MIPAVVYSKGEEARAIFVDADAWKVLAGHHVHMVMLNDGATFGPGGEGFVRLNFGTPRALLTEGLERMRAALAELSV